MECNTEIESALRLRAVLLYPGPQSAPFSPWLSVLQQTDTLAAFSFRPFAIIQKPDRPLSLDELRLLAKELKTEDKSRKTLSFCGPLGLHELFPRYHCPCLQNISKQITVILSTAHSHRRSTSECDHYHSLAIETSHIHQGYLCNAIIQLERKDGINGFSMETGREVWLPSARKSERTKGSTGCIQP